MAAPKSSAKAVAIVASIAVPSKKRASQGLRNLLAASDKHSPVTMPR